MMEPATAATPHPEEVKELAYQLWAFVAGRQVSRVAELLASDEYGNHRVPDRTLRHWVAHHNWAQRVTSDIEAIAPDLRHQTFSELLLASREGAHYLRQVIRGDTQPNKDRLVASLGAIDRVGFSPTGKGVPHVEAPKQEGEQHTATDLANLSPDQLMALEAQYRSKRRP